MAIGRTPGTRITFVKNNDMLGVPENQLKEGWYVGSQTPQAAILLRL